MENQNTKGTSLWKLSVRILLRNKLAVLGAVILLLLVVASVLAPFAPKDPNRTNIANTYAPPSKEHLLGTDEVGRDVFARLLYGGRVSLSVGLVSTSIAILIGVILGSVTGYVGGTLDNIVMRIVDIVMSLPFFVIAITVAAIFGPSLLNVMLISGLLRWPDIARIVRAEVMSIKEREFVEASKSLGLSDAEIIYKHILPNVLSVIVVYATLGIASGILSEAGLSYLGLGVKEPRASWGNMLSAAQSLRSLRLHWWLWAPPGLLIFATILSINFLGDGLRDAIDPKIKR